MKINTNTWNRWRYTVYQPIYDLVGSVLERYRERSIAQLQLPANAKILISGAGTGLDLPYLRGGFSITAIDLTPFMLRKLKKRAADLNLQVDARKMDAQNLSLDSSSFDAVILHLIVAVIPDPVKCLQEAERVLKPGGQFVIMDKFIPGGKKPGVLRKILDLVTGFLFSTINRDIDQLLTTTSLQKQNDISLKLSYRIIYGKKPA